MECVREKKHKGYTVVTVVIKLTHGHTPGHWKEIKLIHKLKSKGDMFYF